MADNSSSTTSDHDNRPTDNRTWVFYIIVGTVVPFTIFIVALRFYARKCLSKKKLCLDDWMTLASMALILGMVSTQLAMTGTGLGHHKWTLTDAQIMEYMRLFFIDIAFYIMALGFIKFQILLQYYRVFAIKMRKVTIWVMVITWIWTLIAWFGDIFTCHPVAGWWDPSLNPTCLPTLAQWYFNAGGNILTDFVIFALPIPVLWKLNIPRHERISLLAIFGLGFFCCGISIIRVSWLSQQADDDTFENVNASGWSVGETCCAMVVSCLPTLRPVLRRIAPRFRSQNKSKVTALTASDEHSYPRPLRTFGGGYMDGPPTHQSSGKKTTGTLTEFDTVFSISTEELTGREDDVEMGVTRSRGEKSRTGSSETIDDPRTALPIQIPNRRDAGSGPRSPPGGTSVSPRYLERESWTQEQKEEYLGLRNATHTTIQGSSWKGPPPGLTEPVPVARHDSKRSSGIRIKRDVVQDSGPR